MKYPLRHVLVVDDDTQAADALAGVLQRWFHCQAHAAYDGADAIEQATQHRPDAVVLKADLRGVTGVEVAAVLRRLFRQARPKLIAIGAGPHERHRGRRAPPVFDAWLGEPLDLRALMNELGGEWPTRGEPAPLALRSDA
ncbi:MAG TPA: response regulator [Ideonella sp.]|jgi:DNA-binding response OmpR family regulator|nr:response regulator [Ideonella sp.]